MAKVALLVGVSEYEPGLNPLPSAARDVEAMRRVLTHPEMGGFAEANVIALKDPQRQEMEEAIYRLFTNRQKDDLLLFYFSGHGIKDENSRLYLSTRVTRLENGRLMKPSAVAATFLHECINESKSQRQILILDCCFSGAIAQGLTVKNDGTINLQEHLGGKGRAILTSSTSTQYSFQQESSDLSIYTHYLVEGIEKGTADQDGDGWIAADELHEYASGKVMQEAPVMTPKFYPVEEGYRILLAKSAKDDPKVQYRREVERLINQSSFSIPARRMLNSLKVELKLTPEEAETIEAEVLYPYQEYQRKLQEYEHTIIEAIQADPSLDGRTQTDLKDYQLYLGLTDDDVASINKQYLIGGTFEFFTDKGIKSIMLAQEESRRLGHNFVGAEMLLLGLIGEGTSIPAKVLRSMGVNLKDARIEVEKIIGRGSEAVGEEIPFTPRALRAIELSLREARWLQHSYVGTEHLLLGIIDAGKGVAPVVLESLGVNLQELRNQILQMIRA